MFGRKKIYYHSDFEEDTKLCEELDFAATEAYKLLRTNLTFTLPDSSKKCNVIGVTSSVRGEGKSTTSINLAYVLAATGNKVLLIDADLRLPTIAKKLKLSSSGGLSSVLLKPDEFEKSLCVMEGHENWHVLTSGSVPPNPTELLGSSRMARLIESLSEKYNYIVLDLPPVNIVSDALVASPLLDGMLLVVRQNFSSRRELNKCWKHLELSGVKLLGFVLSDVNNGSYAYRYRYKYRYKKNYYTYEQGKHEKGKGDRK